MTIDNSPASPTPNSSPLLTKLDASSQAVWHEIARRDPSDAYPWAMVNRRLRGQPLMHIPMFRDLAGDQHPRVVLMKAAQIGATEFTTNLALYAATSGFAGRGNVLFLLPTQDQMADYVAGRFDAAIEESPRILAELSSRRGGRRGADSRRLKVFKRGRIYFRGSESQRQVASVDADWVFLDEFQQMAAGTYELAEKRGGSSAEPRIWAFSTPGLPDSGIHSLYLESDQRVYMRKCPGCWAEQAFTFPDSIDVKRAIRICRRCGDEMDPLMSGRWVPQAPGNTWTHGYHMSKLDSPWTDLRALLRASELNTPLARQHFMNSDLGLTFSIPGGGLAPDDLDSNRREYWLTDYGNQPCDMGVDVGTTLHVVIREHVERPERGGLPRLWFAGQVSWEELPRLMQRFHVVLTVIDAAPEQYYAARFQREQRRVWLAYYNRREPGFEFNPTPSGPKHIAINRTDTLDQLVERFRQALLPLPRDARQLGAHVNAQRGYGEYYREVLAPQRITERGADGNLVARWDEGNRDDHYAHAEVYAMIAARGAPKSGPMRMRRYG